jgi:aspartyl-tRNA(Asn)/glutamyl-tRNA(Gln) amidotransferase subunit C
LQILQKSETDIEEVICGRALNFSFFLGIILKMGYDGAMITKEEVFTLADLARIEVADDEVESIRQKMEGVLEYVSEVQGLSSESAFSGMPETGEHRNVLREDAEPHETGKYTDSIIKNAPDKEGNYVKVKKIL